MKRLVFLTFNLLISSAIFGVTLEECQNQGREHMNPQGITFIDPQCEDLTLSETNLNTQFLTGDNVLEGHGFGNLLYFIKRDYTIDPPTGEKHVITGEQSKLESIHVIKIDQENEVFTVLANDPPIVFNFRFKGGNVASIRTLNNEELMTATNLVIANSYNQLGVIHENENKIVFYNRFADKDGRADIHKTDVKAELRGSYTELNQPSAAVVAMGVLLVYNQGDQKLRAYNLPVTGDQSPAQSWDMPSLEGKTVIRIDYDSTTNKVIFYDAQELVGSLSL
jgi:hypothetical protein